MSEEREQLAYVAIHEECGKAVAASVFREEHPEVAAREVQKWRRYKSKPLIKLLPLEYVRENLLFCECSARKRRSHD